MFFILGSQHCLQSLHSLFWSGAGQVLSSGFVDTVDVLGQLAIAGWSIIWPENLITKFFGHSGRKCFTQASRVGIQCWTCGVSFATANIFNRCSSSCTSPESCHLNSFDFFELINSAIAPTHSGDRMAFRRLYCAAWTTGNT